MVLSLGQRLLSIPGVGPITASVLAAEMGDGKQYGSSRDFAASIGLVPPGVRLLVVLSDSYRHGPGAVKSG
jgi:hypothetical protein